MLRGQKSKKPGNDNQAGPERSEKIRNFSRNPFLEKPCPTAWNDSEEAWEIFKLLLCCLASVKSKKEPEKRLLVIDVIPAALERHKYDTKTTLNDTNTTLIRH